MRDEMRIVHYTSPKPFPKDGSMVRVSNVWSKRRGDRMAAYMPRRLIGGWTHTFASGKRIGWCWASAIACREREKEGKEEGGKRKEDR
jgi:hypothetical protein